MGRMSFCINKGTVATVWDSEHKNSDIILSEANLKMTVDTGGYYEAVFASLARGTGKHYFEVEVVAKGNPGVVGINSDRSRLDHYPGSAADATTRLGYGWYASSPRLYHDGSIYTSLTAGFTTGDILMFALDMDNGQLWIGKNNGWIGHYLDSPNPSTNTDPVATGLSGAFYPVAVGYVANDSYVGRFDENDFDYTMPTGFSAWQD